MNPIKELVKRGFTIWNIYNWKNFQDMVCVKVGKKLYLNPSYDEDTQALAMFYLGLMSTTEEAAVNIQELSKLKVVINYYNKWKY